MKTEAASVLFVDDDTRVLASVKRKLHQECPDWTVIGASSVPGALEVVTRDRPDVIISDVMMPVLDGFELLRQVNDSEVFSGVPVIMLTGKTDVTLKRKALSMGAIDLLNKPIVTEDLVARIASAVRFSRQQNELRAHSTLLDSKIREQTRQLWASRNEVVWRLAAACECRDGQTGRHITRISRYTKVLAEELDLSKDVAERYSVASTLHDVGKIGVPDAILSKPAKLDRDERAVVEKHTLIGWELLKSNVSWASDTWGGDVHLLENPLLDCAATIALGHHERWDGTGYPFGHTGDAIPLEARIVAIADVYDAMSHVRSYKPAIDEAVVFQHIVDEHGKAFDPFIVEAFVRCREQFHEIVRTMPEPANETLGHNRQFGDTASREINLKDSA